MATIADLRQGKTQDELTEALGALVQAIDATGRAGKLVLTISAAPAAKGSKMLRITATHELKAPKPDVAETLMFTTAEGGLVMEDPDAAPRGNMRGVEAAPAPLREVAHAD